LKCNYSRNALKTFTNIKTAGFRKKKLIKTVKR